MSTRRRQRWLAQAHRADRTGRPRPGWGVLGQATPPAAAVVPGANGRIVFQSTRDGDFEIYSMGPKGELGKRGKKARKLTTNNAADFAPAWLPDGKRIPIASGRDGNNEIYVMNANGNNQTRLTTNTVEDFAPTWSPDGTRIAFATSESTESNQVFSMAADGSQRRRLTKGSGSSAFPDWQAKP